MSAIQYGTILNIFCMMRTAGETSGVKLILLR